MLWDDTTLRFSDPKLVPATLNIETAFAAIMLRDHQGVRTGRITEIINAATSRPWHNHHETHNWLRWFAAEHAIERF